MAPQSAVPLLELALVLELVELVELVVVVVGMQQARQVEA